MHTPAPSLNLADNTTPTKYKLLYRNMIINLFLPQNTIYVHHPREEPGRHLWARLDQTCPTERHGEAPLLSAVDKPPERDSWCSKTAPDHQMDLIGCDRPVKVWSKRWELGRMPPGAPPQWPSRWGTWEWRLGAADPWWGNAFLLSSVWNYGRMLRFIQTNPSGVSIKECCWVLVQPTVFWFLVFRLHSVSWVRPCQCFFKRFLPFLDPVVLGLFFSWYFSLDLCVGWLLLAVVLMRSLWLLRARPLDSLYFILPNCINWVNKIQLLILPSGQTFLFQHLLVVSYTNGGFLPW